MGLLTQNESKKYLGMDGLAAGEKNVESSINWAQLRQWLNQDLEWDEALLDLKKTCGREIKNSTKEDFINLQLEELKGIATKRGYKTLEDFKNLSPSELNTPVIAKFCALEASGKGLGWSMPTWGYAAIVGGVLLFGWLIFRKK